MAHTKPVAMQPLFLELGDRVGPIDCARFALLHRPVGAPRSLIVYAHPFGEELNKSRRMVALQARAMAQAGHAVLVPDLLGCGDSAGDFGDATWSAWVDELVRACDWLRQASRAWGPNVPAETQPLTLWGLRAGALLATAAAERLGDVQNLLFWQPHAVGKTLLQQFLRLHSAGSLVNGNARGGTPALLARLAGGDTVEVAGYRLSPGLASGLDNARLVPVQGVRRLHWLELSTREGATPGPMSTETLDAWRQTGTQVHAQVLPGTAFWQTAEIEEAPALVEATLALLAA